MRRSRAASTTQPFTKLPGHTTEVDPQSRDEQTEVLLEDAAACPDEPGRRAFLDQVVLLNGPVAEAIAHRYRSRGIEADDLVQVAYLGLVKAAQGYRREHGPGFLAYAIPTVSGEIKRHFRDHGWIVRPPRRIQELRGAVAAKTNDLAQRHGRPPTAREIADELGVDTRDLAEAELADGCYRAMSLDAPFPGPGTMVLADLLVDEEDSFGHVETVEALRPALAELSERDRRILMLRYVRGWTQEQIGQEIGVSQMQVSRLLNRILTQLRTALQDSPDQVEHLEAASVG